MGMSMVISMSGQLPLRQLERVIQEDTQFRQLTAERLSRENVTAKSLRISSMLTKCYRRAQLLLREETPNMLFNTLFASIPKLFIQVITFHQNVGAGNTSVLLTIGLYAGVICGYMSLLVSDMKNAIIVYKTRKALRQLPEAGEPICPPEHDALTSIDVNELLTMIGVDRHDVSMRSRRDEQLEEYHRAEEAYQEFQDAKKTFQKFLCRYVMWITLCVLCMFAAGLQTACDFGFSPVCLLPVHESPPARHPSSASDDLNFKGLAPFSESL